MKRIAISTFLIFILSLVILAPGFTPSASAREYWSRYAKYYLPVSNISGVFGYNYVDDMWVREMGQGARQYFQIETALWEAVEVGFMKGYLSPYETPWGGNEYTTTMWYTGFSIEPFAAPVPAFHGEAQTYTNAYYMLARFPNRGKVRCYINGGQVEEYNTWGYLDMTVNVGAESNWYARANVVAAHFYGLHYWIWGSSWTDWTSHIAKSQGFTLYDYGHTEFYAYSP